MKEEYLKLLINQFIQANGIKKSDINSNEFINEFVNWLTEMEKIGKNYLDYIRCLDIKPITFGSETVEIGKGKKDTITNNTELTLITPYSEGLRTNSQEIITGNFEVVGATPVIFQADSNIKILDICRFNRFMTQNPYSPKNIEFWDNLHNFSRFSIMIGAYGDVSDKDIDSKLNTIDFIKEKLEKNTFIEDFFTSQGHYFYIVASNKKNIERTRKRKKDIKHY